ncbi:hypothetical protein PI95_008465 [Hassallia byssoidea VB512170]|uniref:Uncharacterized protein n=1 Tax=Hassallia byssoidea VB512170 TaxID=1304833 RepID=A0A846H7E2_9CYAN|nr:hypothetical protein [Hassalia byssoidea]NEU72599.1 hypothetical protein [Hassalia byssoidea VB512170]
MGDGGQGGQGEQGELKLPMPDAQCPMPDAQCPMPDAQCPITHYPLPITPLIKIPLVAFMVRLGGFHKEWVIEFLYSS